MSTENEKDHVRPENPIPELLRLLELAAKYPEVGPPLAELAYKIGYGDLAERVVRMGLEGGTPGVEYYFVAANAARRERKYAEALAFTLDAVKSFATTTDETVPSDEGARLLHLVRNGFAMLMFDAQDVRSQPAFVTGLAEALPGLEPRLGGSPFFHVLLAQVLWYADREASEREWVRAAELGEHEHTWNARGTWYKEADHDVDAAENAYRSGLEQAPHSALLLHNLAQILVDKASRPDADVGAARQMLKEADDLVRAALREDGPKGLRRHVHATRDRLNALRASLPRRGGGGDRHERGDRGDRQPHAPEPGNEINGNTIDANADADNVGNVAGGGGGGGGGGHAEPRPPRRRQAPVPVEEEKLPDVGAVMKGRVQSLTAYGAFVAIGRRLVGLLHKSELAHEHVNDPAQLVNVGDEVEVKVIEIKTPEGGGRPRIGLSRRALLPAPANAPSAPRRDDRRDDRRDTRGGGGGGGGGGGRGPRDNNRDSRNDRDNRNARPAEKPAPGQKFLTQGRVSLGEMLLAKIKESGGNS